MRIITDKKALRQKSEPVGKDEPIALLVAEMNSHIDANKALGLSAPQLGVFKRVIVVWEHGVIVNPVIVDRSMKMRSWREVCLSCPGYVVSVRRHDSITVVGEDLLRNPIRLEMEGMDARVVQHELDHLDGKLVTDYIARKPKSRKKNSKGGKR